MVLEQNETQPLLTFEFVKFGFDIKKLKRYCEVKITMLKINDGFPTKQITNARFYGKTTFDFQITTEQYLALLHTTLKNKGQPTTN